MFHEIIPEISSNIPAVIPLEIFSKLPPVFLQVVLTVIYPIIPAGNSEILSFIQEFLMQSNRKPCCESSGNSGESRYQLLEKSQLEILKNSYRKFQVGILVESLAGFYAGILLWQNKWSTDCRQTSLHSTSITSQRLQDLDLLRTRKWCKTPPERQAD